MNFIEALTRNNYRVMNEILTKELKNELKAIVNNEIEQLPGILNDMKPKERLDYILKLMPFVIPKVKSVSHSLGEPLDFDW